MSTESATPKMTFEIRDGSADMDDPFTHHTLIGKVEGLGDSSVQVTTYHLARDRYRHSTWDESEVGCFDAWAVFNPNARLEGFAMLDAATLGYSRTPSKVAFITNLKSGKGCAQAMWPVILLRRALRLVDENTLVLCEFGGVEFSSSHGWPTARGWALQLGFQASSSEVVALSRQRLLELQDTKTPWPKFSRMPPRAVTPKEGPVFDGKIFIRDISYHYQRDTPYQYGFWDGIGVSNEEMKERSALVELLKKGVADRDLVLRPADPRGVAVPRGGHEKCAHYAVGNETFEVPVILNEWCMKAHPWRSAPQLLKDAEFRWLRFLLEAADVCFGLDAWCSLFSGRWHSKWDIQGTSSCHSILEINDSGDSGIAVALVDDKPAIRVGFAPDGLRRIMLPIQLGCYAYYTRLTEESASTVTQKKLDEYAKRSRNVKKMAVSKKPGRKQGALKSQVP